MRYDEFVADKGKRIHLRTKNTHTEIQGVIEGITNLNEYVIKEKVIVSKASSLTNTWHKYSRYDRYFIPFGNVEYYKVLGRETLLKKFDQSA